MEIAEKRTIRSKIRGEERKSPTAEASAIGVVRGQMTFFFRTFFTLTAAFFAPRSSSGPMRWPHA